MVQIFLHYYQQKIIKQSLDKYRNIFRKYIMPIYWAFLTYMLLRPGIENKEYSFMFPNIDKVLHFSIFGFLGFCILVAFPNLKKSTYLLVGLSYALLTEILQDVMGFGRSLEILDLFADMAGFSLAILVYNQICKRLS